MIKELPILSIDRRSDARSLNQDAVSALAESIAVVGLINPIRVREVNGRWEVSAGSHRLAACEMLGLADIECNIVSDDDLHAELSMIDENLCRNELSPAERASQTARRKAIYEELNGPAKANSAKAANAVMGRGDVSANLADTFSANTAAATGQSERTVQRDAERGEKVIPEVIDMISGTKLDTGTYLDKLKKLPPNEQVIAAKRDLALIRNQEREKAKPAQSRASSKIDADVKSRAAKEVADIIAEYVPGEWWDAVKSNLYAAGATNIANELNNITGQSVMDRRFA